LPSYGGVLCTPLLLLMQNFSLAVYFYFIQ
jgi:hypothetical protein